LEKLQLSMENAAAGVRSEAANYEQHKTN